MSAAAQSQLSCLTSDEEDVILFMGDCEPIVRRMGHIASDAGKTRAFVKKTFRKLRSMGLAQYGTLMLLDEYEVAGSGTWLTGLGLEVQRMIEAARAEEEKPEHWPDLPAARCVNHPDRTVRDHLDGEDLCQECCDQWARNEGAWQEDET